MVAFFGGHLPTNEMSNKLHILQDFQWSEVPLCGRIAPRFCHGLATFGSDCLILFGGTIKGLTLNDLHVIRLDRKPAQGTTATVYRCTVSGQNGLPEPAPRNGMTLSSFGAAVLMAGGGVYGEAYFEESWVLEVRRTKEKSRSRVSCMICKTLVEAFRIHTFLQHVSVS